MSPFLNLSDESLVNLAKLGDRSAFGELVRRHQDTMNRIVGRILKRPQDVEDVVQETFLRAFIKLETFKGNSALSTWLASIAINGAYMSIRKTRRLLLFSDLHSDKETIDIDVPSHSADPEKQFCDEELLITLRRSINDLPPRLRKVIDLRTYREMSIREISQAIGISRSATKSRLLRARRSLEVPITTGC